MTITDEQIEQLWYEVVADAVARSAAAGDFYAAAICAKALGKDYSHFYLSPAERAKIDAMTVAQARAKCKRAIK